MNNFNQNLNNPIKFDKYQNHNTTLPEDRLTLSPDEEKTLELFFQLTSNEKLQAAIEVKKSGNFSKLAMLYDITEFYDRLKWISKKQYEVLRKNIFNKKL